MDRLRLLLILVAVVAWAGLLAACGSDSEEEGAASVVTPAATTVAGAATTPASGAAAISFPLTIENCGVKLTFTKPAERAVTLAINTTEIMLALGLKDKLAGVVGTGNGLLPQYKDQFAGVNVLSEKAFPLPSREILLAANPDLIISGYGGDFSANTLGTRQDYLAQGINTYQLAGTCEGKSPTIDDTYEDLTTLGKIFGAPEAAAAVIASMKADAAKGTPPATPVKVFNYDSGEETAATSGAAALINGLIAQAGGRNVFADIPSSFPKVSWEEVVNRNPDVIVITDYLKPVDEKIAFLTSYPPLANVTAIKERRFVVIGLNDIQPSVRNGTALATLANGFSGK
jgi:iron complex transport system substrate-binding protein